MCKWGPPHNQMPRFGVQCRDKNFSFLSISEALRTLKLNQT